MVKSHLSKNNQNHKGIKENIDQTHILEYVI